MRPARRGAVKLGELHWAVIALGGGLVLLGIAALPMIGALRLVSGLSLLWILAAAFLMVLGIAQVLHYSLRLHHDREMSATKLAMQKGRALLSPDDVHFDLALKQFLLASRHQRRLSCIAVEVTERSLLSRLDDAEHAERDAVDAPPEASVLSLAAMVTAEATRGSDLTIKGSGSRQIVVLCPETGWEGAVRVARKIDRVLREELGLEVRIGVSTFPDDAASLRELLERAESELQDPRDLGDTGQLPLAFPGWDASDFHDRTVDSPVRAQSA